MFFLLFSSRSTIGVAKGGGGGGGGGGGSGDHSKEDNC